MPAASYREGPDGHLSRKQNSKRRRAKCSPSFVSGCVIGHGGSSPRCIPECLFVASFALHAFENGLPLARYARHASEKPRKQPFGNAPREDLAMRRPLSLHGPLESCTARKCCHLP